MASSAAASSCAADTASTSGEALQHWHEKPHARTVVHSAWQEVVENAKMDLLPTIDNSRLLGLWSKEPNVEVSRYACVQRAITNHGLTAEQLTDAWMQGGSALQELVLGIPDVAGILHGEYLKRRGGLPGKAISVLPGNPDPEEHLPPIPGGPIPQTGDRSKDVMMALIRLLRAEGNEERARQLEEHERGVSQMLGKLGRV